MMGSPPDKEPFIETYIYLGEKINHDLLKKMGFKDEEIKKIKKVVTAKELADALNSSAINDSVKYDATNLFLDISAQYLNTHDIKIPHLELRCRDLYILRESTIDLCGANAKAFNAKLVGNPGYNGGKISISVVNPPKAFPGKKLHLKVNGGQGHRGGEGNPGERGKDGGGEASDDKPKYDGGILGTGVGGRLIGVEPGRRAERGKKGGKGGPGGAGGKGGNAGLISLSQSLFSHVITESKGGSGGEPGKGGDPGPGGFGAKEGIRLVFTAAHTGPPLHKTGPDSYELTSYPATIDVDKTAPIKADDGPEGDRGDPGAGGEDGKSSSVVILSSFTLRPRL